MDNGFKMKGSILPHLIYSVILPAFFLGGALLYNPFGIKEYYTFGNLGYSFHIVMLSSIIFVCCLMTRPCLYLILEKNEAQWWQYGLWCSFEMLLMSSFIALYTVLFKGTEGGYFAVLPDCIKFVYLSLIYPYGFLIFIRIIKIKDQELDRRVEPADNSLVRFHDEHQRLKLSIAPSAILFVSSEFNYVRIYYLDGGKVKEFMLRTSMKSLESLKSKALVRCQRSYFVNPEHISVLRKDSGGFIFAEMNIPDVPAVPVSKQYYDSLSALL